ncbi:MAG: ABC transporter permease [Verrucomicrobia bacterium]|nr:MAG: ABC transporter permease [Verrucomicrobiota bacterium]
MTTRVSSMGLIVRSLRFYWRTHLGVLLGTAVACAILTGALVVGDSMRATLRHMVLARLGKTEWALTSSEHYFRAKLADDLAGDLKATVAPVMLLRGSVALPDGRARANNAQVVGVEDRFWKLGADKNLLAGSRADEAVINGSLAAQLGIRVGDSLVVRVEEPSLISRDAPLSGRSDAAVAVRVKVRAIAEESDFGRFGLQANQVPPLSVFIPLSTLQTQLKRAGQANVLLTDAKQGVAAALRRNWTLTDVGLELHSLADGRTAELRTARVFLDPAVEAVALSLSSNAMGVLTYFANEIRRGTNATPYSFVTAVGQPLQSDVVTINGWLADDLGAQVEDVVTLRYFVMGERRELRETNAQFRVGAIVSLTKDDSWMPAYPGLADAHNCREWTPGIPIATERIRPKDEEYWSAYRGTPKLFLGLAAGQQLWSNRFGRLTAVRFPNAADKVADVERALKARLDSATLGLFVVPVRAQALAASVQALDFGQLFIGFSFFLIVAALLLTALLFAFNLEQRNTEAGLLRALGFTPRQVRRLLWWEGFAVAGLGALLGVVLGALYTRLTLLGLAGIWRDAVGNIAIHYHANPISLVLGVALSLLAAGTAMALVQRGQTRRAPADLLAGGAAVEQGPASARGRLGWWLVLLGLGGAIASLLGAHHGRDQEAAEIFFGSGACLLLAGLGFSQVLLATFSSATQLTGTLAELGRRNASRRRRRSLATISVLASGVFLFVAVSAFQRDPRQAAQERHSGTGGFALFAQSTLPIYDDLNSPAGRAVFGLSAEELRDVNIVSLRLREGDDASCLNLNRAQQPRLLGVLPDELEWCHAFSFTDKSGHWALLNEHTPDETVPAMGDEQTVVWGLGKKLGDTLPYTDERGRTFTLRIVGVLANSVLQGSLLISAENFVAHFPATGGYRMFLIDAPPARAAEVSTALSRALQDRGLEVVPAWQRLAQFMAVENTYLGIFQVLGGLGLLLGSIGLGLVVLRNVLERRSELALLLALGFRRRDVQRMVLHEHWLLIVLGLVIGLISAVLAIWPTWTAAGSAVPVALLGSALGGLLVSGLLWTWLAMRAALRGPLLAALRTE